MVPYWSVRNSNLVGLLVLSGWPVWRLSGWPVRKISDRSFRIFRSTFFCKSKLILVLPKSKLVVPRLNSRWLVSVPFPKSKPNCLPPACLQRFAIFFLNTSLDWLFSNLRHISDSVLKSCLAIWFHSNTLHSSKLDDRFCPQIHTDRFLSQKCMLAGWFRTQIHIMVPYSNIGADGWLVSPSTEIWLAEKYLKNSEKKGHS